MIRTQEEKHLQTTTCHHARRKSSPLRVVIGTSFLNTMIYKARLPTSASSIPNALLILAVDVSSNLWAHTISGTWSFTCGSFCAISYTFLSMSDSLSRDSSDQ